MHCGKDTQEAIIYQVRRRKGGYQSDLSDKHIVWRPTPIGAGALNLVVEPHKQGRIFRLRLLHFDPTLNSCSGEKHALGDWYEVIKGVVGPE